MTLPPEIAEALKIKAGDEMEYTATDGDIIIRKAKKV